MKKQANARVTPVGPDYVLRGKVTSKSKQAKARLKDARPRWWKEKPDDQYTHINASVYALESRQAARTVMNIRWLSLYGNYSDFGVSVTGGAFGRIMPKTSYLTTGGYRYTWNIVESCVDTLANKVGTTKTAPVIVVDDGRFNQKKRSVKLNKFVKGKFKELDVYEKGKKVFVSGAIFGMGALRFYVEDGRIKAMPVFIGDIKVDEEDGRDGNPRTLWQTGYVNRDVLMHSYPSKADMIRVAPSMNGSDTEVSNDLVAVTEAWHLPSGKDAGDGMHTMALGNCTLQSEGWDRDWFPFAFFRYKERNPMGWYGQGLVESLASKQIELNYLQALVKESVFKMAHPNVFVPANSGIQANKISNYPGVVIHTQTGVVPTVMVPQAQSPEVYQLIESIKNEMYAESGISTLSAAGLKPAGVNSAVAMREQQDIESGRFQDVQQRYEAFYCEAARIVIAMSRDLYVDDPKLMATAPGGRFIETVKWKDASLEDDEFTMEMFSENTLPSSPTGRLQTVTELAQAGIIDKDWMFDLLDIPDLQKFRGLKLAALDTAMMVVDEARWEGRYIDPTPMMDLKTTRDLAQAAYLETLQDDTPNTHREALLMLYNECDRMLQDAEQQAAASAPPSPAAPGAAMPPQASPVPVGQSPLVPQQ